MARPALSKSAIASHYDVGTIFYWLLWGRHVHHGLWYGDESPKAAQENLIEQFVQRIDIQCGERVLDVGCGMGGSAIHLARRHKCHVTGITLSRVQRMWATWSASWHGVVSRTDFRTADAERVDFPAESFDVIWIIECSEHLFDKPRFFQQAARWLRPGGRIGVCAWLAADEPCSENIRQQIDEVCDGMLCPSLGTMEEYGNWLAAGGACVTIAEDWTRQVQQTWEICLKRVYRTRLHAIARMIDRRFVPFLDRFTTMLDAYKSGAMRYGCIVGEVPGAEDREG